MTTLAPAQRRQSCPVDYAAWRAATDVNPDGGFSRNGVALSKGYGTHIDRVQRVTGYRAGRYRPIRRVRQRTTSRSRVGGVCKPTHAACSVRFGFSVVPSRCAKRGEHTAGLSPRLGLPADRDRWANHPAPGPRSGVQLPECRGDGSPPLGVGSPGAQDLRQTARNVSYAPQSGPQSGRCAGVGGFIGYVPGERWPHRNPPGWCCSPGSRHPARETGVAATMTMSLRVWSPLSTHGVAGDSASTW